MQKGKSWIDINLLMLTYGIMSQESNFRKHRWFIFPVRSYIK
jgi:hypothetical protein